MQSRRASGSLSRFRLNGTGRVLVEGRAIGQRIGAGSVRILTAIDQMAAFKTGDVLVADMTDPDWEPIMKRASAIVTNRGGRTCHAAIIARELGIPAVVGTGDATDALSDGLEVTVSCADGETGLIYEGLLDFVVEETEIDPAARGPGQDHDERRHPRPGLYVRAAAQPRRRPGPAGVHHQPADRHPPQGAAEPGRAAGRTSSRKIRERIAAYDSPRDYYVKRLAEGVATIAAAFAPEPVIVRMSDFKSNEYANLIGGPAYEPHEENPMIGFRGASRYLEPYFRDCFDLECEALSFVRDEMGLTNVKLMIPFVRTLDEAGGVIDLLAENGLRRGENGLEVIMMCELPSNALLADEFLDYFDGFSIGSNDMTQLTLGLDRDSAIVAGSFDERDPAVKKLLSMAIRPARRAASTSASAARGPATTRTSPSGWWTKASTPSR